MFRSTRSTSMWSPDLLARLSVPPESVKSTFAVVAGSAPASNNCPADSVAPSIGVNTLVRPAGWLPSAW